MRRAAIRRQVTQYRRAQYNRAAPVRRVGFDGDSLSATSAGVWTHFVRWAGENPGIRSTNIAVAGASIRRSENATNNLVSRIHILAAFKPADVFILIGANDVGTLGATTWMSYIQDYVTLVRTVIPGVRVHISEPTPRTGAPWLAERATIMPALRAAVGTGIDGLIPFGSHPVIGPDAAASDTTLYYDGLHQNPKAHRYMYEVFSDVINPIARGPGGNTSPTIGVHDVLHAPLSTDVYSRGRVTDLRPGIGAAVTASGSGDFILGTGSAVTSATVFNGDVITSRVPTSASNDTEVTQTLTSGSTAKVITTRTQLSSYTSTTTLDPSNKHTAITLADGNLSASASSGGNRNIRSTAESTADLYYFEVTPPSGVDGNFWLQVFDNNITSPWSTAVGYNDHYGFSMQWSTFNATLYLGATGAGRTSYEGINLPAQSLNTVMGCCVEKSTGRFWIRNATGWLHGDPALRDGGFKLKAPLANYWSSGTATSATKVFTNYGATAFAYSVPTGARAYL